MDGISVDVVVSRAIELLDARDAAIARERA
jgi:hypothetical protein